MDVTKPSFVSIILTAAGLSSRMGDKHKLLLPWNEHSVIEEVLWQIRQSAPSELILVTGHMHEKVQALAGDLADKVVYNHRYKEGLTSSIQCGISASEMASEGYMIAMSDMALIPTSVYRDLILFYTETVQSDERAIVIPTFHGQWGQPRIFAPWYKEWILSHDETDGCKKIIQTSKEHVYLKPYDFDAILLDMDTPETYKQMLAKAALSTQ